MIARRGNPFAPQATMVIEGSSLTELDYPNLMRPSIERLQVLVERYRTEYQVTGGSSVAGRGRRELLHAQQPADPVQRRRHVGVRVGVHAAGNGACLIYDGQRHPVRG
jgi:hypothetical protein